MGKGNCVSFFTSREGNGTENCGIDLGKADWEKEAVDDFRVQLAMRGHCPVFMIMLTPISWS